VKYTLGSQKTGYQEITCNFKSNGARCKSKMKYFPLKDGSAKIEIDEKTFGHNHKLNLLELLLCDVRDVDHESEANFQGACKFFLDKINSNKPSSQFQAVAYNTLLRLMALSRLDQ
jgi:hypothetical protein